MKNRYRIGTYRNQALSFWVDEFCCRLVLIEAGVWIAQSRGDSASSSSRRRGRYPAVLPRLDPHPPGDCAILWDDLAMLRDAEGLRRPLPRWRKLLHHQQGDSHADLVLRWRRQGAAHSQSQPHPSAQVLCGMVAGLLGQSVTYPLDVIRRRMQVRRAAGKRASWVNER